MGDTRTILRLCVRHRPASPLLFSLLYIFRLCFSNVTNDIHSVFRLLAVDFMVVDFITT